LHITKFNMQDSTETYNILIVEDNIDLSCLIAKNLKKNTNYNIYTAHKIKQAKKFVNKILFDLICLDIILPDGNGLKFCKEIKANPKTQDTKVLILTKKSDITSRLESFANGADDYLSKPFHPSELDIRIKNLIGLTKAKQEIKYKNFYLDKGQMRLNYEKYNLPLTKTDILILEYLFKHEGFANLEMLTQYISSKKFKSINNKSVIVSIKRLKDKLERNTGNPFIKTKYGGGYYLP
jgi:DNA-binding response OmpR family regulator